MKFGRLIEYIIRIIFLKKLYAKLGGETISRLFSKQSKLSISLDQQSIRFIQFVLLHVKLRAIKMY